MIKLDEKDIRAVAKARCFTDKLAKKAIILLAATLGAMILVVWLLGYIDYPVDWPAILVIIPFLVWLVKAFRRGNQLEKQLIEEWKRDGIT